MLNGDICFWLCLISGTRRVAPSDLPEYLPEPDSPSYPCPATGSQPGMNKFETFTCSSSPESPTHSMELLGQYPPSTGSWRMNLGIGFGAHPQAASPPAPALLLTSSFSGSPGPAESQAPETLSRGLQELS